MPTAFENPTGPVLAGRYRVEALLGEGGMARVFRVRHVVIGKVFAAKILRSDYRAHERMGLRFMREAKLLSDLEHSNVISIVDFGRTDDGDAFYIMEYLEGCSLADRIDTRGALPSREALEFTALAADALAAVHELGAVHRDLTPQNIMVLDRPERIKLIDFGIAHLGPRLTAPGISLGTPDYMAPEQIGGQEPDARSDLYALGLTLFESLTGVSPFLGPTVGDTLQNQLHRPPPTLASVQPSLAGLQETQRLLVALLDKDPEHRPGNAAEVARRIRIAIEVDLDKVRSSTQLLGSDEPKPPPQSTPPVPSPRRRWLAVLGVAVCAGFAVGGVVAAIGDEAHVLKTPALAGIPTPTQTAVPADRAEAAPRPRTEPTPSPNVKPSSPSREESAKNRSRSRTSRPKPRKSRYEAKPMKAPRPTSSRHPKRERKKDAWDLRDPFG